MQEKETKLVYNDGTQLGVFSDGKASLKDSEFIENYKSTSIKMQEQRSWKDTGYGANFRGEVPNRGEEQINAFINSVNFTDRPDEVIYTFTINEMSGVYKKNMADEKSREMHVVHSKDLEFLGADYSEANNALAVSIKRDASRQSIGLIDLNNNDYKFLTDGDVKDENPSYSLTQPNLIYYNSSGCGRDYNGNFVEYGDSSVCSIDTGNFDVREVYGKPGQSFIKPKESPSGDLYCIQKPTKFKQKKGNIFLDILLIPVRLVLAIFLFLEFFVQIFTGKKFITRDDGGNNPARGRKQDAKKVFLDGAMINIEKEEKRNAKSKDKLSGIVPKSWQLVKIGKNGVDNEIIIKGVADYDFLPTGEIVYANGRNVIKLSADGKKEKIFSTSLCLKVTANGKIRKSGGDFFDSL